VGNVTNLAEFNRAVSKYSNERVDAELSKFTRRIALGLLVSIVQNTPVDTGRAKGAWIVSLESASEALTGIKGESAEVERQAIANGTSVIGTAPPFGTVYINNNVDYIIYLEEGTAKIAPFAMAANALNEIRQQLA